MSRRQMFFLGLVICIIGIAILGLSHSVYMPSLGARRACKTLAYFVMGLGALFAIPSAILGLVGCIRGRPVILD